MSHVVESETSPRTGRVSTKILNPVCLSCSLGFYAHFAWEMAESIAGEHSFTRVARQVNFGADIAKGIDDALAELAQ